MSLLSTRFKRGTWIVLARVPLNAGTKDGLRKDTFNDGDDESMGGVTAGEGSMLKEVDDELWPDSLRASADVVTLLVECCEVRLSS